MAPGGREVGTFSQQSPVGSGLLGAEWRAALGGRDRARQALGGHRSNEVGVGLESRRVVGMGGGGPVALAL